MHVGKKKFVLFALVEQKMIIFAAEHKIRLHYGEYEGLCNA